MPSLLLALLPFVLLLAVSTASAAYDDGDGTAQCESHVYPLDGSTLKPVRREEKKIVLVDANNDDGMSI